MIHHDYIAVVERAQRGDLAAFSELVVQFQDLAIGTAYGWLGEIETARDVSQEAFIEAHLHLRQLREPAAFPAWLRRLVIKHCDRATRRRRLPLAAFDRALDVATAVPEAEADIAQDDRARWLRLGIEALPTNERVVVALHYFADVSGPDLSRFLELPLSTIKQRLRRARARLRDDGDRLMQETLDKLRPSKTRVFADEVAFFIALRAGDRTRVQQMLVRSPDLVHAQQEWEPSLVYEGVLPFASRATALITAIERDDLPMQTLLLLAGANPNVVAATGNTPLHVAAMRGLRDVAVDLLAHGASVDAVDTHGRTPADWANLNGHSDLVKVLAEPVLTHKSDRSDSIVRARRSAPASEEILWTGIKALDLFAPIRRGRFVRVPFKAGIGTVVLLGELSKRITLHSNARVLWTGFAQRPFDLRDWEAEMAEFGLAGVIEHKLVGFEQTPQQRRDAFAEGLTCAEALRDAGDEVLVVLLCDTGFESDVDASLIRLSGDAGPGRITTIVVTPFPEKPEDVWRELTPPYKAQIILDRRRAKKLLFPSIDPLASLSDSLTDDLVGRRHAETAQRAKQVLEDYARLDPDFDLFGADHETLSASVARAHRLLGYFRQPFLVAEPFSGHPGELVGQTKLLDAVETILDQ